MDIKFNQESYSKAIDDIKKLLDDHMKEIEFDNLVVASDLYLKAEEKGLLKVYTARDNGTIAGYCVTVISQCYKTTKIKAHQEALYVKPDYRRFGVGGELLQYVDTHLKQIGVHISSQSVPSNMNWDNLLIAKGYKKFRTIYEKEI